MPSNHLILCQPLLLLPSIFPSIRVFQMSQFFTSGGQSSAVSASASVLPMNIQDWLAGFPCSARDSQESSPTPQLKSINSLVLSFLYGLTLLKDGLAGSPYSPKDSQESSPTPHLKSINSLVLSFLYGLTLTSIRDYWKNHSFDYIDLCWQSNVCNMLSRLVLTFLPRNKRLLISWPQWPSAVTLEPKICILGHKLSLNRFWDTSYKASSLTTR